MKQILFLKLLFTIAVITGVLWNFNVIASTFISAGMGIKIGILSGKINSPLKISPTETASLYRSRADAYFVKSDYSRAIADYGKIIEIEQGNAYAYSMRGSAYMKTSNFQKAADDFEMLLKFSANIDEKINAANLLTNACVKSKEPNRAIGAFNELLKTSTATAKVYRYRGSTYGKFGDFDKAIADYSKAMELDPQNADFVYGHGVFYYRKDDYENAIRDFSKAIELNPRKLSAYYNRGTSYYRMGNDEAAYADFMKVIELRPVASLFKMRICYKIAAIGISELTGYRLDKGHHYRKSRATDESIYIQ